MAVARFGRQAKRPCGFCAKMTAVAILGLCFIFIWSMFSFPSTSVTSQRSSFGDIAEPTSANTKVRFYGVHSKKEEPEQHRRDREKKKVKSESVQGKEEIKVNGSVSLSVNGHSYGEESEKKEANEVKEGDKLNLPQGEGRTNHGQEGSGSEVLQKEKKEEGEVDGKEGEPDGEGEGSGEVEGDDDLVFSVDQEFSEKVEDESGGSKSARKNKKKKKLGPLFDPKAHYTWKLCSTRSKHNYIPCIDIEGATVKLQRYRHRERSCPRAPPMCIVPLPRDGYRSPVRWPDSKMKILYKNVAHPKLAAFVKTHNWVMESGEYLTFPQNQSEFKGGILHYVESIEEMVPDIEWGKNIRVVLDIGCTDASFGASLLDKEVLALSLGLKNDLVDLAQVALERGLAAVVSFFGTRRLPFPSGVFDVIHCGDCSVPWHSTGGKLLIEMNRILRPGGYFILSTKHDNIEDEEAMTTLTASICWNVLAHKTDEVSEMGVKIYQKPESNDIYELRRKKNPPLCKEDEKPDAAWYVPMKACLNPIPVAIEQRGTEWPEEWPKRLETFPEWLSNKEKVIADTNHWKAILSRSYLTGLGIDWSNIRNVMDMKASYGGFAAALSQHKVWVMNVVPIHAPDTLPVIYERGLFGIYHDWCEPFATYPRSYDLLHADHLFARLKNRCKLPVAIVVEMERILRPGGWAIIRDKAEILDPLEGILRSLRWEIRMTYVQGKEGIICAQKTIWRP
ncbi:probable methyltransferase PMT28 [Malania oleifera]|uniref:probable methyltransferase PMT28 n=1 Tax=Malania oleifera TaxID=397392 RepID=UPI0025AEB664|nr:probable methyltransferase PMT28 [Malania oleifera]